MNNETTTMNIEQAVRLAEVLDDFGHETNALDILDALAVAGLTLREDGGSSESSRLYLEAVQNPQNLLVEAALGAAARALDPAQPTTQPTTHWVDYFNPQPTNHKE